MNTISLRQQFISYFRDNEHKYLKPSDVYIKEDQTLLFVNAGMNQLKNTFIGIDSFNENYNKLMNSQICIRAGGKHNDFDDVGKDSYHLTCFEMLGSWSLNSYKKEKAIDLAFNFLINICKLKLSQIYVTYFMGDYNIPVDVESLNIWKKYLPENRIIKGSSNDNFWSMDDNGPCGPCTEIHYDLIENRELSPHLVNSNDPTLIEIWNIVFIQYNKINNNYILLDNFFVDAGMGLERISMILQNKKSIYELDSFRTLISYAQILSGNEFYTDDYNNIIDMSYRIFADHIRTSVISVCQGVDFEAHGRGFILRKIFRRMLAYYFIYLTKGLLTSIMNRGEIKLIISYILNYFLIGKHDIEFIQNKFIKEEKLALDKWNNIHLKYKKYMRKFNNDTVKVCYTLKTADGIDCEFIKNIHLFIK